MKNIFQPLTLKDLRKYVGNENNSLRNIDLSELTSLKRVFLYSKNRKNWDGIEEWDVSNIENFIETFKDCKYFNNDLSCWNVKNGKKFNEMFSGCIGLKKDFFPVWKMNNAKSVDFMLKGCYNVPIILIDYNVFGWKFGKRCNIFNGIFGDVEGVYDMNLFFQKDDFKSALPNDDLNKNVFIPHQANEENVFKALITHHFKRPYMDPKYIKGLGFKNVKLEENKLKTLEGVKEILEIDFGIKYDDKKLLRKIFCDDQTLEFGNTPSYYLVPLRRKIFDKIKLEDNSKVLAENLLGNIIEKIKIYNDAILHGKVIKIEYYKTFEEVDMEFRLGRYLKEFSYLLKKGVIDKKSFGEALKIEGPLGKKIIEKLLKKSKLEIDKKDIFSFYLFNQFTNKNELIKIIDNMFKKFLKGKKRKVMDLIYDNENNSFLRYLYKNNKIDSKTKIFIINYIFDNYLKSEDKIEIINSKNNKGRKIFYCYWKKIKWGKGVCKNKTEFIKYLYGFNSKNSYQNKLKEIKNEINKLKNDKSFFGITKKLYIKINQLFSKDLIEIDKNGNQINFYIKKIDKKNLKKIMSYVEKITK